MNLAGAPIAFVIISHEGDGKLARLLDILNKSYDFPPIAIHHDFSQAHFDYHSCTPNVLIVNDWVRTGWARWSVVEGALKALRLLSQKSTADWFFLLSASDYPAQSGRLVRRELSATPYDAFLDARPLVGNGQPKASLYCARNPQLVHFDAEIVKSQKRRFYCSPQFWIPVVRRKPHWRLGKWTYRPAFDGRHPFVGGTECYYGDHWFTINRKAAMALLAPSELNRTLQAHYRYRTQPDESYYATLLANTPGIQICLDNRRFADWRGGGAHPIELTLANLPAIAGSQAFFARKVGTDIALLDALDRQLLLE